MWRPEVKALADRVLSAEAYHVVAGSEGVGSLSRTRRGVRSSVHVTNARPTVRSGLDIHDMNGGYFLNLDPVPTRDDGLPDARIHARSPVPSNSNPRDHDASHFVVLDRSHSACRHFRGFRGSRRRSFPGQWLPAGLVHAEDVKAVHGQPAGDKAPIREILHCPLSFAGVHLLKDLPEYPQVAYHYCKPLNSEVNQCVLYDGTGPDARLIGVEYLVSDALYQKMPAEEKTYWHDHKYEVDAGLLKSLTQSGDDEKKTLAAVRTLWGKTYHTWTSGKSYPSGPPRLFWSVTGEEPFVLADGWKMPQESEVKRRKEAR